jgi:tetratricopeptide (TPR) repeat protein
MAKSSVEQNKSAEPTATARAPVSVPVEQSPKTPARQRGSAHLVRDLTIALVVLGGGLAFYYRHVQISVEVNHIAKKGKDLLEKDNPQDFYEAEKQLKKALELDPKDEIVFGPLPARAFSLSSLAEMNTLLWGEYGVAERRSQAEEGVKSIDALDPHLQERYAADSYLLLYSGHPDQAAAAAQAIIDRNVKGAAHIYDALGRAQRKMGKLDEARKSFTDASKAGWRNPRFNADLAQLYSDTGDLINAQVFFQKAIEINADHLISLIGRAQANIAQGEKVKLATDDLMSLLGPRKAELTPGLLARAYAARAQLKIFNKLYPDAAKDADAAIKADQAFAPGYFALGLAVVKADTAKAIGAFDRAIALDPYVVAFYFETAKALQDAGQGEKAIAMLQRYEKAFPKDENYYLLYGDLLNKKGDADGALAQYDLALKANKLSAQANFAKGQILFAQKKNVEAAEALANALNIRETPEAHMYLGYIFLESKKPADAAVEFENALDQFKKQQVPKEKLTAMRDDFSTRLKKGGAPKTLLTKFSDDAKEILQ